MLTDSAPISLSKCCLLQSLKRSLKFPIVWLVAWFFTHPIHILNIFFPFPLKHFNCFNLLQSSFTTIFYTPVSSSLIFSAHPSISAVAENPCRCWGADPFPVVFSALWCSMGWGLMWAPLTSWQLRSGCHLTDQVVTTPLLYSILQVSQRLLLPVLISVLQAKEDVLGKIITWPIGSHVSSRWHLIQFHLSFVWYFL